MAKTGRPLKDNPKKNRLEFRYDDDTDKVLTYLAGKIHPSKSEVIRIAIDLLYKTYESKIKPLDDEANEIDTKLKDLAVITESVEKSKSKIQESRRNFLNGITGEGTMSKIRERRSKFLDGIKGDI